MDSFQETMGSAKREATLLVLFIPSVDRLGKPIEQDKWVEGALDFLGNHFGGATAFPQGRGVWRDDERNGELIFDEPIIVNCYTSEKLLEQHALNLRTFLHSMGKETKQGAVGLVIDREYLEIRF